MAVRRSMSRKVVSGKYRIVVRYKLGPFATLPDVNKVKSQIRAKSKNFKFSKPVGRAGKYTFTSTLSLTKSIPANISTVRSAVRKAAPGAQISVTAV